MLTPMVSFCWIVVVMIVLNIKSADSDCPADRYGDGCNLTCPINCRKIECYKGSGTHMRDFPDECSDRLCDADGKCNRCGVHGRYGFNCLLECPENCYSDCDPKNGTCTACKLGFYGKNCTRVCGDNCTGECDIFTGECAACNNFYGEDCSIPCPPYCEGSRCNETFGTCTFGCQDGFYGESCTEMCPAECATHLCHATLGTCLRRCRHGFYGEECDIPCPSLCGAQLCHVIHGRCLNECIAGFYGDKCSQNCSADCFDKKCSYALGTCVSGCNRGMYGETCSQHCPNKCDNGKCGRTSGNCLSCDKGFYGEFCSLSCSEVHCRNTACNVDLCEDDARDFFSTTWPPFIGLTLSIALICFLLRKSKRKEKGEGIPTAQSNGNLSSVTADDL